MLVFILECISGGSLPSDFTVYTMPKFILCEIQYPSFLSCEGVRLGDGVVSVRLPPRHRFRGGILGREEALGALLQVQLHDHTRHHLPCRHVKGRPSEGRAISGMI